MEYARDMCSDNDTATCVLFPGNEATRMSNVIQSFQWFQSVLIWAALASGVVVLVHMIYCLSKYCRNICLLFTIVMTGFMHLLACVGLLSFSEMSSAFKRHLGGTPDCVDYAPSAILANTIVLLSIAMAMLVQNVSSYAKRYSMCITLIVSIISALMFLYTSAEENLNVLEQQIFATYGNENSSRFDVYWTVCLRSVDGALPSLLAEYGLIYIPIFAMVLLLCCRGNRKQPVCKIAVLSPDCKPGGWYGGSCICAKLNSALLAVLVYSSLLLFLGRPALILYNDVTSGHFRDVLPSLLQTVTYCFLCSEYLFCIFRQRRGRDKYPASKILYV